MTDGPTLVRMRALAHPLRLRMLSLLTGAEFSAAEIAVELGTTQANASYHLRQLAGAGLIVDAGEVKVRGGRARRYRYDPVREDRAATPVSASEADAYVDAVAQELLRRHRLREAHRPAVVADAELWVDPEVWRDTVTAFRKAVLEVHQAARPPRTLGTIRTSLTAALFSMADATEPSEPAP